MKKLFICIAVFLGLVGVVKADNLTAQVFPGVDVSVPGSNLSVDTLMNLNGTGLNPAPQFLAGLSSRIISYDGFGANMGAVTNTGFSYRAYYSLSYDYVNKNPNLLMLISQITVSAFYSTLFDGRPNFYGLALSKKLF